MNNKIIICGFLVFVLAGFCLAQQQNDLPSPGRVPGDLFYGLDRFSERVQMAFTANDVKKAELHVKFANERLSELNKIIDDNKTKYVEKLTTDEETELEAAQSDLDKAEKEGKNVTLLAEKVANMTAKHLAVLQGILDKVPEQARDSILHAINVSSRGHEQAVASITKARGEPVTIREKLEDESGLPQIITDTQREQERQNEAQTPPGQAVQGTGKLVMKITDKPAASLNISKLDLTISSIRIHASANAIEGKECVEEPYVVLKCENETEENENCTQFNITIETCVNETKINQTCTEAECVNGTFVDDECVNGTLVPKECINNTYVELECENETEENETCTPFNVTKETCENETLSRTLCNNVTGGGDAGWKILTNQSKTFDLIAIKGVSAMLGSINLDVGKYTQIRLYLTNATVTINGVKQSLKIPSGVLKLVHPFTIKGGDTLTLTLDFDAEKSVHQAGTQYIMRPTIKIIES